MDDIIKTVIKYMNKTVTATIYSVPNFSLETFIALFVCGLYFLLHLEITDIALHTITLKPNRVIRLKKSGSTKSLGSSTVLCSSQSDISLCSKFRAAFKSDSRHRLFRNNHGDAPRVSLGDPPSNALHQKIDRVIGLSPEEYIRRCKERRRLHPRPSLKSLTALCKDTVSPGTSKKTANRHIEMAKESLQLAKLSSDTARYFGRNSEALTQSLFDMLEKLVLSSSLENPLPHKGDIATLVFDAGNLRLRRRRSSNRSITGENLEG